MFARSYHSQSSALKIHPNGRRLALLDGGRLRLWDMQLNREVGSNVRMGHFTPVTAIAQHVGSQQIASGDSAGHIVIWNREDGRFLKNLVDLDETVADLAFTADGTELVVFSQSGQLSLLWKQWRAQMGLWGRQQEGTNSRTTPQHGFAGIGDRR